MTKARDLSSLISNSSVDTTEITDLAITTAKLADDAVTPAKLQDTGAFTVGSVDATTVSIGGTAITSTAAELNILDGVTATAAELNFVDGVTSNVQTQINTKVAKAGDTMTGNLSFGDNNKAIFGAGSDLEIYHDGSNSYISDQGTNDLKILATDLQIKNAADNEFMMTAVTDGAVTLYYDNAAKLATTATGVTVTGTITTGGTVVTDGSITDTGDFTIDVGTYIILDADQDGNIYLNDAGVGYGQLSGASGNFTMKCPTSDKDIIFTGNDGGSTVTALTLDMSSAGNATFNGTVLASSGTNSLPSLSFSGDPNTGIYNSSADNIGFAIGGVARAFMSANQFNITGNVVSTGLDCNGNADVSGTLGVTGVVTANAGVVVDNITIDGTTIALSSGTLTLDVAGEIRLDAGGGNIQFMKGGTEIGRFFEAGTNDFYIYNPNSDKDIIVYGNDSGTSFEAVRFDMSSAGAATFNSTITAAGGAGDYNNTANVLTLNGTQHTRLLIDTASTAGHVAGLALESNGQLTNFTNSGSGSTIANDIGVFTIDSADDIILDAGGSDILLRASGAIFGSLRENSSNFRIKSDVSDKDMLFLGNDGGSEFTALTLDMSDGGNAIFSGQITSSRGAATSTYGFRHNGAGRYMRMGCPNASFAYFETDTDGGFNFDRNVYVNGALSKNSGSFKIDHPLPAKTETHNLVHSFIEGPQADNIYRGKVALVDGSATVNIDDVAGMTDGTFAVLNREVQCFTSNETGWTAVRGSVSGNILTIEAQDASCTDTISWMVIGERQDKHMYDTEWTDENGKVIVEPLKEK